MFKILIVDDEPNLRSMLAIFFEKRDFNVDLASSGEEALILFNKYAYDLIISDVRMPDLDGMGLLQEIKKEKESPPVILITAYASDRKALKAIQSGAADYIKKPFDMEELHFRVMKALDKVNLEKKVYDLKEELSRKYAYGNIVGKSNSIQRIISMIKQIAHLNTTVLITGESGVGKEVIARAIHHNGQRRSHTFVSVNCGALPENLLESELFGYVRGAFTGAEKDKTGLFKEADHGTIFLDEISEMSPSMQVKLLSVLQNRVIRPVGSTKETEIDIRIIAATNKDLTGEVENSHFREDLYYRINVIHLEIPPLRRRTDDIPILTQHFIQKYCEILDIPLKKITAEAMQLIEQHTWPGNVRELENIIERTIALEQSGTIAPASLPDHLREKHDTSGISFEVPPEGLDMKETLDTLTRKLIEQALEMSGGSHKKAARLLHLTQRSFRYLVSKHEIKSS